MEIDAWLNDSAVMKRDTVGDRWMGVGTIDDMYVYVYDMCIYVYVDMYLYDLHDLDYMMFLSLLQTFR